MNKNTKMLIRTVLHVSLCMLLAQHITGEPKNIDGLQNEDIVLCPTFSGELEDITWKLGNNKIAEYDSFKTTTYYGDFKKETELNITSGCLKMNYITDRRDGLYTAELQIGGQLQDHVFKLKVYRPVSKPNVTCSVTDSNVTVLCEGDESLGDQYRWEVLENQVRRGTTNGKNLTFSKEENHNIEYTCIFSNLKSEERSDPIKNCFVPGGRSHILVLILVLLAVAGLIVWVYKYYSKSQVRGTHGDSMAGHNGTCMDCFIRKPPFIKINQHDSENKPATEGEATLSPAPWGEAPLFPTPLGEAALSSAPEREVLLSPAPQREAPLSPVPQREDLMSSVPEGEALLSPAPEGEAPPSSVPEGEAPLSSAPEGEATLSSAPEREDLLSPAPQGEDPLSPVPEGEAPLSSAPEREDLLSPAPQGEAPLSPVPEGEAPLSSAPEGEAPLSPAAWGEAPLSPAPQGEAPLSPVPQREDLLSSAREGEAPLSLAPEGEDPLSPAPQGEASLSPAPQGEAQLSPALQDS